MKNQFRYIYLITFSVFFLNCNQIKLTNEEAKLLVIKTLNLPQSFNQNITGNSMASNVLEANGFITKTGFWLYGFSIHPTKKSKPYIVSTSKEPMYGTNTINFRVFDIELNEITGIAINKDEGTAIVRFSLKASNITPIGMIVEPNINTPKSGELLYKKFDTGWQLLNEQNKPSLDLLRKMLWPNRN